MVLIAASVITKSGRALVTRQFVADMTRARLEGLNDAFPKLVATEKSQRQHTFIETDSVRYVYQPLDNVYMVLITTKASNILEDLETLRLFSRVIPEYCHSNEESEILDKAFDLIFAFDEIVVLGYRENVNLAQIRTFTEMDSHEERIFNQIQIAQQRVATNTMNEKVKEIKRAEKLKKSKLAHGGVGASFSLSSATSISSNNMNQLTSAVVRESFVPVTKPVAPIKIGGGKALKLGNKATNDDIFIQQLKNEGQNVSLNNTSKLNIQSDGITENTSVEAVSNSPVHFISIEKLNAVITREGALKSCEVSGSVSLYLKENKYCKIETKMINEAKENVLFQVHPNLDKTVWQSDSLLRLKSEQKPFPLNVDVGVLKWRNKITDERALPLLLVFWLNEDSEGCVVNVEYTLQLEDWQLNNLSISIPLPPATAPVVSECDENYVYLKSKSLLVWNLEVVDSSNKSGVLEFSTTNGHSDHFFPVHVQFTSNNKFSNVLVEEVHLSNEPVDFSMESILRTEKYEIVDN